MHKSIAYLLLFLMTFVQPAQAALALQDWTSRRELYRQIHQGGHNDGNGQRVQKTVNGVTQKFLWNGSNIAKEYKADGTVRADYQLGAGAKIDGKYQYYLTDIQGSTLGVADDTGKVIAQWSYSDYGQATQTSGDKNLYQPFLYTGQELDAETGWYHLRARHYAPKFGKFLARDPIASANLYSYCGGDPINFSDPSGQINWNTVGYAGWKIVEGVGHVMTMAGAYSAITGEGVTIGGIAVTVGSGGVGAPAGGPAVASGLVMQAGGALTSATGVSISVFARQQANNVLLSESNESGGGGGGDVYPPNMTGADILKTKQKSITQVPLPKDCGISWNEIRTMTWGDISAKTGAGWDTIRKLLKPGRFMK